MTLESVNVFSEIIQSDQKVSVHLTITVYSCGAQRLFDHPVFQTMSSQLHLINMMC